jgi:hypothetical protein
MVATPSGETDCDAVGEQPITNVERVVVQRGDGGRGGALIAAEHRGPGRKHIELRAAQSAGRGAAQRVCRAARLAGAEREQYGDRGRRARQEAVDARVGVRGLYQCGYRCGRAVLALEDGIRQRGRDQPGMCVGLGGWPLCCRRGQLGGAC